MTSDILDAPEIPMLGDLLGQLGGKVAKSALPKIAEQTGDLAVEWLRDKFALAKIDPLTARQEARIKELIVELIIVRSQKV